MSGVCRDGPPELEARAVALVAGSGMIGILQLEAMGELWSAPAFGVSFSILIRWCRPCLSRVSNSWA